MTPPPLPETQGGGKGGDRVVVGNDPRFLLALDFDNTLVRHSKELKMSIQPLFPRRMIPEDVLRVGREKGWDQMVLAAFK